VYFFLDPGAFTGNPILSLVIFELATIFFFFIYMTVLYLWYLLLLPSSSSFS